MSVDSRIVTMKFDNLNFEKAASKTMGTLGKLKESLNFGTVGKAAIGQLGGVSGILQKMGLKNPFSSAQKGIQELGGEAGRFNLTSMDGAITGISRSWMAMATVAITAISNITNRVVSAGLSWAKGFTFAPIMDGLKEYETNLQSIQTIQANTDRPLPEITAALDQLNAYSDQTIYNFGQMAQNIGTFTAAGVDLKTSVSSIKGIANMAALSGSSSQQAATAMYQLSQAIASGKVGLQDWNSVVNAGMGGKKLQNALAQTAVAMGEIDKNAVKGAKSGQQLKIMGDSFRESIMSKPGRDSWLTSGILTTTLKTLDGRFSSAALKEEELANGTLKYNTAAKVNNKINQERAKLAKEGVTFTDAQFQAVKQLSNSSFEAAQKVKTLGQVFDIAKETIGSGWSASFRNIFGNLDQAKELFTGMSDTIGEFIKGNARARNNMLATWSKAKSGGRADLIEGLKNSFKGLMTIITPIKDAFREIFPKKTASDLISMTKSFLAFSKTISVSGSTADKIHRTFAGIFAIFSIIGKVISGVASGFKAMFSSMSDGSGGLLDFSAGLGDALVSFNNFLAKSGIIKSFFTTLGQILGFPLKLLTGFGHVLASMFGQFDAGGASKVTGAIDKFSTAVTPLQAAGQKIMAIFGKIGDFFAKAGDTIGGALGGLGDAIAHAITPETFGASLDVINTTLLGGIVLMLRNFFKGDLNVDLTGGLFDGIKETLGSATGALKNMQTSIKADIILKIAIAMGILAAALTVLSMIDPKSLAKAMAAMTGGFAALLGTMLGMIKVMGPMGAGQIYLLAGAMTKLATAMLILAVALKILASMDFGDMLRGLAGLAAMLFIVQKAMIPMAAGSKGMGKATTSLILLGIALNIMAVALKIFASMSWEELGRGLAGVTAMLLIISGAMRLMPKDMLVKAAAITVLAVALNALGVALKIFASMSWEEMAKGFAGVAGGMVIIAAAMRLMPKNMPVQAASLILVATALNILGGALKIMGSMGWDEIGKGMVVLAGSLLILSVALNSMGPMAIAGSAALLVAAAALTILLPVLVGLGAMSWEAIAKGMTALAATFIILGVAGFLLAPLTPVLIGLGLAITLIGAGLALAGAGALAFGMAFGVIVATGTAGVQVLAQMLGTFVASIPGAMKAFGQGVVAFISAIANSGPKFVGSMSRIISAMLSAIIKNVPKMGKAFLVMIITGLRVISVAIPKFINVGFKLITSFLNAINKNIGKIVNIASSIIVKFINGIARNLPRIIQSGVNLIIKFINGVSRAIDKNSKALGEAGARLGISIIKGIGRGISGAAGIIKDAAIEAAKGAFKAVKNFFKLGSPSKLMRDEVGVHIPTGMALGIDKNAHVPVQSIEEMGRTAMDTMKRTMSDVSDALRIDGNLDPVIAPVLDLTALTKEANKISGIVAASPRISLNADTSFQQASAVSAQQQANEESSTDSSGDGPREIKFEQNNYSPKAIDPVTNYRQTKSLLSLAKETLS